MIFYLVFSFLINGTSLWIPLDKFETLEACEARGAYVLDEMQKAYPDDHTMSYKCQEVRDDSR